MWTGNGCPPQGEKMLGLWIDFIGTTLIQFGGWMFLAVLAYGAFRDLTGRGPKNEGEHVGMHIR
tara:strand:+ start:40 stop:231 length:192 start_codon:yes stop_codon:yes gene_type:complete